MCHVHLYSVWRNPKSEQNRIQNFFPMPIFFDTESDTYFDTKFFRYRIQYFFWYQNFSKPIPILFPIPKISETDTDTIKKMEKFRNREVSKPKCHTLAFDASGSSLPCFNSSTSSAVAWGLKRGDMSPKNGKYLGLQRILSLGKCKVRSWSLAIRSPAFKAHKHSLHNMIMFIQIQFNHHLYISWHC